VGEKISPKISNVHLWIWSAPTLNKFCIWIDATSCRINVRGAETNGFGVFVCMTMALLQKKDKDKDDKGGKKSTRANFKVNQQK